MDFDKKATALINEYPYDERARLRDGIAQALREAHERGWRAGAADQNEYWMKGERPNAGMLSQEYPDAASRCTCDAIQGNSADCPKHSPEATPEHKP